jgi:hypothetical protein
MSRPKSYLYWFLILFGVLYVQGIQTVGGETSNINPGFVDPGQNYLLQYQSADEIYQATGLAEYLRQRALLWSETTKRRNDLLPKLPAVATIKIQQLQGRLLRLLELDPGDPAVLLITGNYHYFYRQKQTALWYYQQAQKFAPDSESVKLALADFYLDQWQSEQAKETLAGLKSPAVSLRMGAACLQLGEYDLALDYLLNADPLPEEWQVIRAKDLCRTYLALGEPKQADVWIRPEYLESSSILCGTLFWELKGWSAWQTGDLKAALGDWLAGQRLNSDYKLWESNIQWLRPDHNVSLANATKDFHDSDLNAAFEITQGQALFKDGQWSLAYEQYLAAIHHDHRSLVGFLGACTVKLRKQEYAEALDLAKQGLAVNQDFEPLLAIRAQAYQKLGQGQGQGQRNGAAKEQTAGKTSTLNTEKSLLKVSLNNIAGRLVILPQDETKNLVGFWVSAQGKEWQWYPWWGSPPTLPETVSKVWVVPTGSGISGMAFYLEKPKTIVEPLQMVPPPYQYQGTDSPLVNQPQIQFDTAPPVITLLGESMDEPGILHLHWSVSEDANCWLQLLTSDGSWRELAVSAASDGTYIGDVPLDATAFCRIAARDQAGNVSVITDKAVNNRLRASATVSFNVNNGEAKSASRWITIKPGISTLDLRWAVSNDQLAWSSWQPGDTAMTWRLNPGVGAHLVFIRYQIAGTAQVCYQVIEVVSAVPDIQSEVGTK